MDRLLLVLGGLAIAGLVAGVVRRNNFVNPTPISRTIPQYLNRKDFRGIDQPWLVAVFTAKTCATCAGVMERAKHLASNQVVVQEIEFSTDKALHKRYGVDSVPLVLIADQTGNVKKAFLGPTTAADLWAGLADLRELSG